MKQKPAVELEQTDPLRFFGLLASAVPGGKLDVGKTLFVVNRAALE